MKIDFLRDGKFKVSIGGALFFSARLCLAGPFLFLVYINDILLADLKHVSYSSLFTDDIITIFVFNKPGRIAETWKKYLENLGIKLGLNYFEKIKIFSELLSKTFIAIQ